MSSFSPSRPDPASSVSEETAAALRAAIHRRLAGEGTDGDLRQALRRLSDEARAKGLHAEQVIIQLKHVWRELSQSVPRMAQDEGVRMLERLVTLCIDEYYAEQ